MMQRRGTRMDLAAVKLIQTPPKRLIAYSSKKKLEKQNALCAIAKRKLRTRTTF
jgi:hypothetical protein